MYLDWCYRHPFVQGVRQLYGPDWRWELAGEWLDELVRPSFEKVDKLVRTMWMYRRQVLYGPEYGRVTDDTFGLFQKAEGVQENRSLRESLMLMVLGDCTQEEMALRFGLNDLDEQLVCVWEKMFFDVRDSAEATGWLQGHVVEPERLSGNLRFVAKLNLAIRGTPETVRFMLDAESRPPKDDAERKNFDEYETAINGWIAANQPFKSEKDMERMLQLNERLKDIDRRCQAMNEATSKNGNGQQLLEALKNFQFPVGSPYSFSPSSVMADHPAPSGGSSEVNQDQG